jgi:hypothetical protein
MLSGIVPWIHVDCINRNSRLLSCPMVVGRVPLRLTLCINRFDKLDIEPILVGMEPGMRIYIIDIFIICKKIE